MIVRQLLAGTIPLCCKCTSWWGRCWWGLGATIMTSIRWWQHWKQGRASRWRSWSIRWWWVVERMWSRRMGRFWLSLSKERVRTSLACLMAWSVSQCLLESLADAGWYAREVSRDGASFCCGTQDKKGLETMLLQGMVLSGQVMESTFYDQLTGQPKPGLSVQLTVLDAETDEKYQCQLSEGFSTLEQLKDLRRLGQAIDIQQARVQLEGELPPKMARVDLQVRGIKGKGGFHTLRCRFAQVAATV